MLNLKASMLVLAGAVGALAAGGAMADSADAAPQMKIQFNAAALATDSGTKAVYSKLVAASKKVCVNANAESRIPTYSEMACQKKALAGAVEQVHSTRLAELHSSAARG
jgi:UrcA family protein